MTDDKEGKRKYQNPLSDISDQALFFIFFVMGAIAIWGTKYLGYNQFVVTAFPLAIMLAYALIALVTKRYRIREDRVGDNIYYLGFLFTLVSLSYALYVFDPAGDGAADIVTNFGIAIFTTIIGLAGRVLFNQMREDPVEYEKEARYSLAEASMELRAQLASITTDLSSFKSRTVQIVEEGITAVADRANASVDENVNRLATASNEVLARVDSTFKAFTDCAEEITGVATRNVSALNALFARIESIEASPTLLADKFTPILEKFDEVASEANKRNRSQTSDVKRLQDMIELASTSMSALETKMGQFDASMIERVHGVVDSLSKPLANVNVVTEGLISAHYRLDALMTDVRENTRNTAEAIGVQAKTSAELLKSIEAELELVREHRDALAGIASEGRKSVDLMQNTLVSLTRNLASQIASDARE